MFSLFDPLFWVYFLYFFIAATFAFFIPGNILIRRLNLNISSEVILSIITGFSLWCLQGFLFGYLQMRFLTYIYLICCLLIWLISYRKTFLKNWKFELPNISVSTLIIIGTLVQLSSIFLNGIILQNSLYFCCGVPDTLAHLALTNALVSQFPPQDPGMSGVILKNYHYLSNLGIADLVRIFHLPLISTQFQYMTVLFSLLLGLSILVLSNVLELNRKIKLWLLFLVYFTGDIIFLIPFLNGKGFDFIYTTLENASSLWISPPRFFAIVVFFAGLSLFIVWLKKKDIFTGMIMAIVFASLIGIKVYVGAIMLGGLTVLGFIFLVKKQYKLLIPILFFYLVTLVLYLPVNSTSGGIIFSGFWRFEDFVVQPSLGLSSLELARRIYLDNHNILRSVIFDLYFGLLYIVFSTGVLIIGFFQTKNSLKRLPGYFTIALFSGLILTCFAGFFFVQKTGGANSSQFLISIYLIGTIYTALAISWWLNKLPKSFALFFGAILVIIISTRVVYETFIRTERISNGIKSFVNDQALDSYKYFTKTKTGDTILIYDESSLACHYIRAIGKSNLYACAISIGAPEDGGDSYKKRLSVKEYIFHGKDINKSEELIKENNISYIYMPKTEIDRSNIRKMNLAKVYENTAVVIYKTY